MADSSVFGSALRYYRKLFIDRPVLTAVAALIYLSAAFGFPIYKDIHDRSNQAAELQRRVLDLDAQLRQQQQIAAALLSAKGSQADFLKPLKFRERWGDDRSRAEIDRLVDYGEYAMSKNDFDHAQRFYEEADKVQPTVTVPYYEGRLAYKRGDLQKAESEWLEAIKRDPDNRFPDLRLYLGVLYYQLGRTTEANRFIHAFQSSSEPVRDSGDHPPR
jgi:tetratricopeptide (TPR) repeat protein